MVERSKSPSTISRKQAIADEVEVKQQSFTASFPRGGLALVGAWGEVADEDIDALVADIYARRAAGSSRRVELAD